MELPHIPTLWGAADRERVALITPDHREITVGALQDAANLIARRLRALGCQPGDAVAFLARNDVAVYELALATMQIGLYLVPINWHLTAPEVGHILKDSGARVLVCSPHFADVCRQGPELRFCTGPAEGFRDFSELRTSSGLEGPVEPAPDRQAGGIMNYTSGTTGHPKGVRRPLPGCAPEPIAAAYAMFLLMFGMRPGGGSGGGVQLVGSPLYHTAVLYFSTSALHLGHRLVLMDRWTPEGCLERIARYGVTASHMVPTQFSRMLALPDRERYDISSLRNMVHSAAPCPMPVKRAMLEWWGPVIYEYYAATEGGGTMVGPEEWLERPGTVGRPWQGADIAICDDDGRRVPAGEVGTVYIQMQQGFEYHRDREKTERAHNTEGYFTVGDAGYLDEGGYLFLCDRKADMIISGGVNIYPAEIEAALIAHPAVLDVAVFGIPDDDWGEQVKAVIETGEGVSPGDALADDILAQTRTRLAGFKCPRTIDFVERLPRDENGKLAKRRLRDPYWAGRERQI